LLAGGGPWVELLRQAARRFAIPDTAAHWVCVEALAVTGRLLHTICPEAALARDLRHLRQIIRSVPAPASLVIRVDRFLHAGASEGWRPPLPQSWDVTSDSIAAWVATVLAADELVLLKSAPPDLPRGDDPLRALASRDYVDAYFPRAADALRQVRFVDLRDPEMPAWSVQQDATGWRRIG
jgi:aspartokinase-like uncharacterized kinase